MKEGKKPSFLMRLILTAIVGFVFYGINLFYGAAMPSVEASVAANQVQDSIAVYAASQAFIRGNSGVWILWVIFFISLLAIWWKFFEYHLFSQPKAGSKDEQ